MLFVGRKGDVRSPLIPKLSIEHAIIHRFADVAGLDLRRVVEVGDGARDAQHLVVRAGGKAKLVDARFQEVEAVVAEFAVLADFARAHVGVVARATFGKAILLPI